MLPAGAASEFQISEQFYVSRPKLLRLLVDEVSSSQYHHITYFRAKTCESTTAISQLSKNNNLRSDIINILLQVGETETGVALLWSDERVVAILPPFPLDADSLSKEIDTSRLIELLDKDLTIAIVLLRLGHYAVGIIRGDNLLASRSGSRYVKNRHRAGGSSQRRFERSRERLIREMFDTTCQVANSILNPFDGHIDYLLMGGERHTLQRFVKRCPYIKHFTSITLNRRLDVERPSRKAIEQVHNEVWKSRILVFTRGHERLTCY